MCSIWVCTMNCPWKINKICRLNLVIHGYHVIIVMAAAALFPSSILKGHHFWKKETEIWGFRFLHGKEKSLSQIDMFFLSLSKLSLSLVTLWIRLSVLLFLISNAKKVRAKQSNFEFSAFKSKMLTLCLSFFFKQDNQHFTENTSTF